MAERVEEIVACCDPVLEAPLSEPEAVAMAAAFKVLADPVRLRLLSLVAGAEETCACDLVAPLGRSQPTISHHLRVLREAGIVESEKQGLWAFYHVLPGTIDELAHWLA